MRWLAIDSSTGSGVAAVETDGGALTVRAHRTGEAPRGHVESLAPMIETVLSETGWVAAPEAVAVGTGPAPFTGLRVGIATAAAYARAVGVPAHGLCSLDAIAWGRSGRVAVVTDARRREVYWAGYADGVRLGPPQVGPPEDAAGWAAEHGAPLIGPGLFRLPDLPQDAITAGVQLHGLVALAEAAIAAGAPTPLTPQYLRRPDIHPAAARKRAS